MANPYETGLDRTAANYQPLTPLVFLERAAGVHPDHTAIIHGDEKTSYRTFYARTRKLASALAARGIGQGDTVSAMLANTPAMLEVHYGAPMVGAVLHAINTRLDASAIAFMLDHAGTKVLIGDTEFASVLKAALAQTEVKPLLIDYRDLQCGVEGERLGNLDYEAFIADGDPDFAWDMPSDEWNALSLNYTSGTTGNPKGVVYHHRGAALMCYANMAATGMGQHPVYLWTLPMFHCNGWCFPWSISLLSGTHVCLRAVRAKPMYDAIADHGVTHLSGAPFVMSALLNATPEEKRGFGQRVAFSHAAAPPPAAVLAKMDEAGFELTHLYGLTETYGPATLNEWHPAWDELPPEARLDKRIRQGVRYHALEGLTVMDPATMTETPRDGETIGEVMFRGNIVMKGYLKNEKATAEAFAGGWFHSGDLGVMHPDGYIQLKDRSKDIIISGGENISSIEVEDVIYKHPAVAGAAVVAKPDAKWGETPCAFVELRPDAQATAEDIIGWCKEKLARYKCPRHVVFVELPKTSTGKIQKFKLREMAKAV
ncbi:MAG: acyl-CoA synthetase [Methyloceanibacter sp.]|uniref:acyl-CoA synthetase n=1 Tax=Methyloceanibacter sp. TaxID=1965321 RepID=UPI003D6D81AF